VSTTHITSNDQLLTHTSFSAALLGLPKLLKEEDIHAEYPVDTDDEYVTEKGFQPTLPGESTKISSALALFRASRILSKVLDQNYPAAATHDLSLQSLTTLENELNEWSDSLPAHLKLTFVQDKPSTDVTGSRSALLVSLIAILNPCTFCSLRYSLLLTTIFALSSIDLRLARLLVINRHLPLFHWQIQANISSRLFSSWKSEACPSPSA